MGINHYTISDPPVESWDEYFYNVANQTARNSKCLSRRIGAVLVRDKSIIGTGYNGPPRGIPSCSARWSIDNSIRELLPEGTTQDTIDNTCPRKILGCKSGERIDLCIASHAEESAIINSARMGICTKDASLYLTCAIPCVKCAVKIINSGVKEVIVTSLDVYDETSQFLFDHTKDVKIRLYSFI